MQFSGKPGPRPARQADPGTVSMVRISSLQLDGSPRLDGPHAGHARMLADIPAHLLPPILVERETMRVVDGMHRVIAATLRGDEEVAAQFYDGSPGDAFVVSVRRNIVHGLPLSAGDRKAAAARIIDSHPHWSDRGIATVTGLSARTVQTVRARRSTAAPEQSNSGRTDARLGVDGRLRPLSAAQGRLRASQIMEQQPEATLRAVAQAAGVSLGTAHDVRERMRRGEDPVPGRHRTSRQAPSPRGGGPTAAGRTVRGIRPRDPGATLARLKVDPSLKYTEAGRHVIRWLGAHTIERRHWEPVVPAIPAHCTEMVSEVAQATAQAWLDFAQCLREQGLVAASAAGPPAPGSVHGPAGLGDREEAG